MNNRTALYYLLAGSVYYQTVGDKERRIRLKKEAEKEIEFFFEKRYIRRESWNRRYLLILTAVFTVNLLARRMERRLYHFHSFYRSVYSKFAPATVIALREYNNHRSFFKIDFASDIFLRELVDEVNTRVNLFCKVWEYPSDTELFLHGNTPVGIELEFSNRGCSAGKLFDSRRDDPLLNFSKYHYYHLMKFMWRFGAYVDSDTPFKQFVRRGGFLEYTFTRPDIAFKPSEPLTSSLLLAAGLIREAVKFTPVRPHSLHVTLQIDQNSKKLPKIGLGETLFLMLCTGHFVKGEGGVYESRLTEGNMKDWAVIRDRKNDSGWVITVEFTHMRVCRGFVKRDVYEPAILLFLAYKNLFNLEDAGHFYRELTEWAKAPYLPDINTEFLLKKIKEGLDKEVSLPEYYKNKALEKIYALYKYNLNLLKDNC